MAERYATVSIAPTKTSIYVGTVTMTMPTFVRDGARYKSTYTAKVFPFAFYNEKGSLEVTMTDEQLAQLAKGEAVEFKGIAHREDGEVRQVEGKATAEDARRGKIKVRVFVSKRIQLIFNTTYQFGP